MSSIESVMYCDAQAGSDDGSVGEDGSGDEDDGGDEAESFFFLSFSLSLSLF